MAAADPPKPHRFVLLILIAAGTLLAGCRSGPSRPNIVLILIDTLRADHLHAYGYPRETSPRIDALAGRGVVFENAITAAPWTLPSAMTLMTGRLPSGHRVENDGLKLAADVPTLAETLRAAGYATSAVVSHIYVSRAFGFDRGFDRFDDFGLSRDYKFEAGMEPRAEQVTDRALAEVRSLKGKPFLLLVHYFDPHWDYDPPPPFATRFTGPYQGSLTGHYDSFSRYAMPGTQLPAEDRQHLIDLYDGEIAYTDAEVGRLLDGLRGEGIEKRTVVALVADHGEEFKEHDSMGHARNLYDEVLRVPLVIVDPRRSAARRVAPPVSTLDLFPTLCALAGVPPPRGVAGASLTPEMEGRQAPPRDAISETIRFDAYRKSLRRAADKLIVNLEDNRREYYDLAADPGETRNRWGEAGNKALEMEQALFGRVEVIREGWNLRWSSDGKEHHFSGSIETEGIFTRLVPLFPDPGRHRVLRGKRIDFDLERVIRSGGISFVTEPPDAPVAFNLSVDGRAIPDAVHLGGRRAKPAAIPFGFAGAPGSDILLKPEFRSGGEVGYFLWRSPGAAPEEAAEVTEAMKERLRSLGYIH